MSNPDSHEVHAWWGRIDEKYFEPAKNWLAAHPGVKFFFAHEVATNAHMQGWFLATQTQKDDFWKKIKTPGTKNGKGSGKIKTNQGGLLGMQRYCCKGTGINEPPTTYTTNSDEFTPEHIKKLNIDYWASKEKPGANVYIWKGPSNAGVKRKTVFSKILEELADKYDHVDDPVEDEKKRRYINESEAYDLTMKFYNNDERLAGTGVRERCCEEILYRYGRPFFKRTMKEKFLDRINKRYQPY